MTQYLRLWRIAMLDSAPPVRGALGSPSIHASSQLTGRGGITVRIHGSAQLSSWDESEEMLTRKHFAL